MEEEVRPERPEVLFSNSFLLGSGVEVLCHSWRREEFGDK